MKASSSSATLMKPSSPKKTSPTFALKLSRSRTQPKDRKMSPFYMTTSWHQQVVRRRALHDHFILWMLSMEVALGQNKNA